MLRSITNEPRRRESSVVRLSVTPSTKCSCSGWRPRWRIAAPQSRAFTAFPCAESHRCSFPLGRASGRAGQHSYSHRRRNPEMARVAIARIYRAVVRDKGAKTIPADLKNHRTIPALGALGARSPETSEALAKTAGTPARFPGSGGCGSAGKQTVRPGFRRRVAGLARTALEHPRARASLASERALARAMRQHPYRRWRLVPPHRGFDGLKFNGGLGGPRARPESQRCARRRGSAG